MTLFSLRSGCGAAQLLAAASLLCPSGQSKHEPGSCSLSSYSVSWYLSAAHASHELDPASAWWRPTGHVAHRGYKLGLIA